MEITIWFWLAFIGFILTMLVIDLGIFHRKAHVISFKEALTWSIVWVTLAMIFALGVHNYLGSAKAIEFLTGYLIEYSLSMDNIFVFVLIFSYFGVPLQYQHRVLFWGILGALVMRGAMIGIGTELIRQFSWIIYVFGAFLIFTGLKMALSKLDQIDPEKNPLIKLANRFFKITRNFDGQKFFTRIDGRLYATPLFLVLIMLETTDLIFAVDSIPAIFAITIDPFIVFTANVFAIMGLRSMYFLLGNIVHKFRYLKIGLSVVLVFIGTKMLISWLYHIPTKVSLAVVVLLIGGSILLSFMMDKLKPEPEKLP